VAWRAGLNPFARVTDVSGPSEPEALVLTEEKTRDGI
jgi:hypothetical protein